MTKAKIFNKKIVVGIDEAGRGPLAGPVVACALTDFSLNLKIPKQIVIRDSKKMTKKQREIAYSFLKQHPNIEWGIGRVSHKVIDKINILEAAKLAMQRAVKSLEKKIDSPVDFLLIDGNFTINLPHNQQSIIKGDDKIPLISFASVVAKVERDRIMLRYHKKYPEYGFVSNNGYPTKLHRAMLVKHGVSELHRNTFRPVSKLLQN